MFYDVAGQKDQRARWIPYFEKLLHGIVFVASVAAFDQFMKEDVTTNRFIDSLILFESLMSNELLKSVAVIVLLNKADLFYKKIAQKIEFNQFLPYYTGKLG